MEHWEKKANGWVFLSHSSRDYEDVKIVRNYLEENGFSAIIFYLRCLEDEDEDKRNKAQELIEWEIEARNIFVLCNSKFAKSSKWVQNEIKHVKKFPEKIYKELDIDKLKYEKCTQLSKLDDLMNRATLFFSYSHKDKEIVNKVYEHLVSVGFKIFLDTVSIKIGENISEKIKDAIEETSKKGAMLIFLSKNSLNSKWCSIERSYVLGSNTLIIPIKIDNVDIREFPALMDKKYLDIYTGSFQENMRKLFYIIKSYSL